jgi:hypothetical protein
MRPILNHRGAESRGRRRPPPRSLRHFFDTQPRMIHEPGVYFAFPRRPQRRGTPPANLAHPIGCIAILSHAKYKRARCRAATEPPASMSPALTVAADLNRPERKPTINKAKVHDWSTRNAQHRPRLRRRPHIAPSGSSGRKPAATTLRATVSDPSSRVVPRSIPGAIGQSQQWHQPPERIPVSQQ